MSIRFAAASDCAAMLAIYAPYIETTITFEQEVPSQQEFAARVETVQQEYPWIVWEEDGKILGYAEINKADTKKQKSSEEKKNSDSKISAEETVTSTENKRETYVIRPGDTLYQISLNRYGTVEAMEQICALNGISANEIIYPGQVIVLP